MLTEVGTQDGGLFSGYSLNHVQCYRKSEAKMAAAQAGNTLISACILDRNAIQLANNVLIGLP